MKLSAKIILPFIGMGLVAGCASRPQRNAQVVQETQTVKTTTSQPMLQQPAPVLSGSTTSSRSHPMTNAAPDASKQKVISAVEFDPGRNGLSPKATAELNRALSEAKAKGQISDVSVAVWSDLEKPAMKGQKLPPQQVKIANDRAKNIVRYIDQVAPQADVKVYNMAQQQAPFAKFLLNQESEVKNQMSAAGVATDESGQEVKGRSSQALILIQVR